MVNVPSSSVKSPEIICPFAETATDTKPMGNALVFSVIFPLMVPLPLADCCAQVAVEAARIKAKVKNVLFIIVVLYEPRCVSPKLLFMN